MATADPQKRRTTLPLRFKARHFRGRLSQTLAKHRMPITIQLKFFFLKHYWWILSIVIVGLSGWFWVTGTNLQVALPALATLFSLFYFLQKQKLEELRLFREIFKECNEKYDELNEKLSNICYTNSTEPLSVDERNILVDYFNLCGEEYFYFKHGFIYPDVWRAWRNGIRSYLEEERIRSFWDQELESNSYYGIPKDL